jgi:parallel beta-helix repeat protein
VITQQGTWCLAKDVSSPLANGTAIDIAVNNVIIDCNGFKVGGLAAGANTNTTGIAARNRLNTTVRNCNVRGFRTGIDITGVPSSGHSVENNRLDNNRQVGIAIEGGGSTVRRNVVTDTGAGGNSSWARAMQIGENVDVIDNLIDGVMPGAGAGTPSAAGIYLYATGSVVRNNRIRNVTGDKGSSYGIYATGAGMNRAADNDLFGMQETSSWGVWCSSADNVSLTDNYIGGFGDGYDSSCSNDGNNTLR